MNTDNFHPSGFGKHVKLVKVGENQVRPVYKKDMLKDLLHHPKND